jgi:hypothetical protein
VHVRIDKGRDEPGAVGALQMRQTELGRTLRRACFLVALK